MALCSSVAIFWPMVIMKYVYPGCVPEHSRDSPAILVPRLCGSNPGRTSLLLSFDLWIWIGCTKGSRNFSLLLSKEWARHRNIYKRKGSRRCCGRTRGPMGPSGKADCHPSLFLSCFTRAALLLSFQCGGGLTRREKGPGRADSYHRRNECFRGYSAKILAGLATGSALKFPQFSHDGLFSPLWAAPDRLILGKIVGETHVLAVGIFGKSSRRGYLWMAM
jgi:hypothetical protein